MIHIVICDDEETFIDEEKRIVEEFMQKHDLRYQIHVFSSASELKCAICKREQEPVIFLLDIHMPDGGGFNVAQRIREIYKYKAVIMFVTAYNEYSVDAFDYRPIHYIRKSEVKEKLPMGLNEALEDENIFGNEEKYFMCDTHKGKKIFILLEDIMYFERKKNIIDIITQNNEIYEARYITIKQIFNKYKNNEFVLIHSGAVVNLAYVMYYKGEEVVLKNGIELYVSRRKKSSLKNEFKEYQKKYGNK